MKTISNRDQIKGAIMTAGRALNLYEVFQSCDCFQDEKDAASLLREMDLAHEIVVSRPAGQRARYALEGMSFDQPVVTIAVPEKAAVPMVKPVPVAAVTPTKSAKPIPRAVANQNAILTCLQHADVAISKSKIVKITDLSPITVGKYLKQLMEKGIVVRFGKDNGARFALADTLVAQRHDDALEAAALAPKPPPRHVPSYDGGRRVINALAEAGTPLTRPLLAEKLGVNPARAGVFLRPLVASGDVIKIGNSRWSKFGLPWMAEPAKAVPPAPTTQLAMVESVFGSDTNDGPSTPTFIQRQINGSAPIPCLDIDAIHAKHAPSITDALSDALTMLRGHLSEEEYRGYLRGNLITLAMRGQPEDLKRQLVFGQALAEVV